MLLTLIILVSFPLVAKKIAYKDLFFITNDHLDVEAVKFEGIVEGGTSVAPYKIKLVVQGSSYCGGDFSVTKNNDIVKFTWLTKMDIATFSIACNTEIEYFWMPDNRKKSKSYRAGEVFEHTLKVGPKIKYESGDKFEKYYLITVSVKSHFGKLPNKTSSGYYSSYSNIQIHLEKDWKK